MNENKLKYLKQTGEDTDFDYVSHIRLCLISEASHIDYVHEQRHMFVSLETPPLPPLERSHIVVDSYKQLFFSYSTYKVIFKERFLVI